MNFNFLKPFIQWLHLCVRMFLLFFIMMGMIMIFLLIFNIPFTLAYEVIYENDLENSTFGYCESLYNNDTLIFNCVDYHNELLDYIEKTWNDTINVTINNTIIVNQTVVEYSNITIIKNNTVLKEIESPSEQQKLDHEYRMKQLELNGEQELNGKYTEQELKDKITEALSNQKPVQNVEPTPFYENDNIQMFVLVALGGFALWWFKFRKKPEPKNELSNLPRMEKPINMEDFEDGRKESSNQSAINESQSREVSGSLEKPSISTSGQYESSGKI